MGLFGSSNKQPAPKQKPLGVDDTRLATNEAARPVPLLIGRQRIAITFITDFYNKDTSPIKQKAGKSTDMVTGYNYYAGIAGLLCLGPVDYLISVFINGDKVLNPVDADGNEDPNGYLGQRGGTNSFEFTGEKRRVSSRFSGARKRSRRNRI